MIAIISALKHYRGASSLGSFGSQGITNFANINVHNSER